MDGGNNSETEHFNLISMQIDEWPTHTSQTYETP